MNFESLEGEEIQFCHHIPLERKKKPSVNFSYCFINKIVLLSLGSTALLRFSSQLKGCLGDGISNAKGKNFTLKNKKNHNKSLPSATYSLTSKNVYPERKKKTLFPQLDLRLNVERTLREGTH